MKINKNKISCLGSGFKNKNLFRQDTRAQHEIVGFVLIVVIVVIIGLFLLVFYIRQPAVEHKSLDVQNFLQASIEYTTECSLSIEPLNLEDLIKSCYKNERCLNEKMACGVLESNLKELVHESWLVSPDKPVKAYFLELYYEEKDEEDEERGKFSKQEILKLNEGNCTGSKTGAEHLIPSSPGNIVVNMEICYT